MKIYGMKRVTWSGLRILLAVCVIMQLLVGTASASTQGRTINAGMLAANSVAFTAEMQEALEEAEQLLYDQKPFSDWAAIGFAKNGRAVPKGYLEDKADVVLNNGGKFDKFTDLTRTAIAYAAAGGGNINNIAGIDLYSWVMNYPGIETEGVYGLATAYIVGNLSSAFIPYSRPNWYPDAFLYFINDRQLKDGSWSATDSGEGNVVTTAIALTATSPNPWEKEPLLSERMKQGLSWLHTQQSADGGFTGSTASTAQVIIALSSLRIDATTFTQPGSDQPLAFLMSRWLPDGGFSENSDGRLDMKATLQAYLALTAYKLYLNGEKRLIDGLSSPAGDADIQIEGPEGTIARGQIPSGGKAIDAAQEFLELEGIAFKTKTDSAGSKVFTSIAGIDGGKYGKEDGWKLAEYGRFGSWMFPENAEGGINVNEGSRLLLYYGSDKTELIDLVQVEWTLENGQPVGGRAYANTPFKMYLQKSNRKLGGLPASGITVTLGDVTKVTDAKGKVEFAGLPPGVYVVKLTGYRNGAAPIVAKEIYYLTVSAPELALFKDDDQVADWASADMGSALSYGFIQGVSAENKMLAPKKALTRAEFAAMLLRLVHGVTDQSIGHSPFEDVQASKWYSDEIIRAAELGITDRVSGKFEPERAITREEAAVMSTKAGRLPTFGSLKRLAFTDIANLSASSLHAIQAVNEHKVMIGSGGMFNPRQTLIREQAAAILVRLHRYLYPESYLD